MTARNLLPILGAVAIAYFAGGCRTEQEKAESRALSAETREAARDRVEETSERHEMYGTVKRLGDRFAQVCTDKVRKVYAEGPSAGLLFNLDLYAIVDQRKKAIEAAGCESDLEWRCIIGTSDEPSGTGPRVVIPSHEYTGTPSIVIRGKDGRNMHIGGNGAGPYWRDGPDDQWRRMGSYNAVPYTPREHIACQR